MNLFEINDRIRDLTDGNIDDDGNYVVPEDELNELMEDKETTVENLVLVVKEARAMADAIGEEIRRLQARKKTEENKADRIVNYITAALGGERFKTAKVTISYRANQSVDVLDGFIDWAQANGRDDLIRYKEPEPNKNAIKEALAKGDDISYAAMVANVSTIIK